jgi:colanic acid/amylovoran biosynthesis glycosyltransferase
MKNPLRIATFVGQFPVVSETFILRQITGLLDLGHEVDIFSDTRGELTGPVQTEVAKYRLLDRTTYMDMPLECAPWELPAWPLAGETWVPGASEPVPNWKRFADALPALRRCLEHAPDLTEQVMSPEHYGFQAQSLSALYRLNRLLALPGGYDVVHAHFGPVGGSFRFVRELWRAPLVVSFHGYDFTTLPRKQGTGIYQKLFETADAVTVNSEFTRGRLAALGCPEAKLHLLPVGVDLAAFPFAERRRQSDEPVRLLTVARLVEIKGHEFVLRALARVRTLHPEIRYDLVGDGPLGKTLAALVLELGLQDIVTLHGARDSVFVAELMMESHLAVLGSVGIEGDAEGQGLFLQEAQACGLPVVATRHGAFPEGMVPGQSGFLVPERDVDELARQLASLIAHPEAWPEMGRCGRAFIEQRYDIRRLNESLVELYGKTSAAFARDGWKGAA